MRRLGGSRWRLRRTRCAMGFERQRGSEQRLGRAARRGRNGVPATIAADQGVFLTETRRLHPDVCAFTSELFYEGRLMPRPENAQQRLNAGNPLDGTGLRFTPVEHTGNQNESPEEVEKVAASVDDLLRSGATWTNKKGETRALTLRSLLYALACAAANCLVFSGLISVRRPFSSKCCAASLRATSMTQKR